MCLAAIYSGTEAFGSMCEHYEGSHAMIEKKSKIIDILFDIIEVLGSSNKKARKFDTNITIYHAEIHTVSAIAKNPGIHVGGLADMFGFTKGAISEILRKLEKKGLARKETDPANLSRLKIYLTEKGETAHTAHMRYHDEFEKTGSRVLQNFSDEQVAAIADFLQEMLGVMTDFEKKA
jgi:DNA-binding MarR family transcriptional regulator